MAASDRLYELCCEVHDCEESLDRLRSEIRGLEHVKSTALALAAAVGDDLRSRGEEPSPKIGGMLKELEKAK